MNAASRYRLLTSPLFYAQLCLKFIRLANTLCILCRSLFVNLYTNWVCFPWEKSMPWDVQKVQTYQCNRRDVGTSEVLFISSVWRLQGQVSTLQYSSLICIYLHFKSRLGLEALQRSSLKFKVKSLGSDTAVWKGGDTCKVEPNDGVSVAVWRLVGKTERWNSSLPLHILIAFLSSALNTVSVKKCIYETFLSFVRILCC